MRKVIFITLSLFLISSFVLAETIVDAETGATVSVGKGGEVVNGLQLIIKSDKEVYEVGEEIKIKVSLKNVGQEGIYIYAFKLIYFISLQITGGPKEGLIAHEYEMPDDWYHIPEKKDFYFLEPQEIYSIDIENLFSGNIRYEIVKPGIFKIKAGLHLYNDSIRKNLVVDGREFGIGAWTGTLTSSTITIEAVERKE